MSVRARFILWTAAVAAIASAFALQVRDGLEFETDVLAMLPAADRDPVVERSVRALADATGRRTLFLVGADAAADARAAARTFAQALQDGDGVFAEVTLERNRGGADLDALYGAHRANLLSEIDRQRLARGGSEALEQAALRDFYTPSGWLRARPFADDPLGLYGRFLAQLVPAAGRLRFEDGILHAAEGGRDYVLVTAVLAGSPFAAAVQQGAVAQIGAARAAALHRVPGSEVLISGVLPHAETNSRRAQQEITLFGSISLAGVMLLVLGTFRGPRPLLLTLLSLGVSLLAALTVCLLVFKRVHIITLVFGSTLIGVAVDYSIHYFADQFRHRGAWDAQATLRHVGPAIVIGMLTTVLGYQAFLLPPFPGLRQMAVFSMTGVVAAGACVLLWYPLLANRTPATHEPAVLRIARRLARWRTGSLRDRRLLATALALAALSGLGLWRLEFVDDIRALQSTPETLQRHEARVAAIMGSAQDTRFFLIQGATPEATLQREEALRERLDALLTAGALDSYTALSRALPSQARQLENRRLLDASVYTPDGALPRVLERLGYRRASIGRHLDAFEETQAPLAPDTWLASPASAPLRPLWLEGGGATAVTLAGVRDAHALARAADGIEGVRFVDRVAAISRVMEHYRRVALACLAAAYAVIGLGFALRYGARDGLRLMVPPVAAALLTLTALGLLGVPANLFNVLALVLVLGIGVDYAVFLREGRATRETALTAVLLAGLTTLLAFGMLIFSETPFIHGIGLTVLLGVSLTFCFALACSAPGAGDKVAIPR